MKCNQNLARGHRLIHTLRMKPSRLPIMSLAVIFLSIYTATAQRPPAVPLITHDPYFSVWSMADRMTDEPTRHWTGAPAPLEGIARIDGKAYRFMGQHPDAVPAMYQVSCTIKPTYTVYKFNAAGVLLDLEFFTPSMTSDLDVLSRPVSYLTWPGRCGRPIEVRIVFHSSWMWIL